MKIVFVSDYVCPYCLAAKEALKLALKRLHLEPEMTWQPFELTREPAARVDTYHDEKRRAGYQVLKEPCEQMKLDMKLPPRVVPRPYTRLAFEGWYFACEHGCGEVYNDLVYRAYFIDEEDIGDEEVLCRLAKRAGLEEAAFRKALAEGVYSRKLEEANRYAREALRITHVPTIYIDGQRIETEAYTPEAFVELLTEGQKKAAQETPAFSGGCGPDGCGF